MPTKPRNFDPDFFCHIYNCGVEKRSIFLEPYDYERFLETMAFYLFPQAICLTHFRELTPHAQRFYEQLHPKGVAGPRLRLAAYCLMPNHFHFLVKPISGYGITRFMSDISDSYTRYFNIKNQRLGGLLQGPYKSKEIRDEGSLLQLARYIHLNPIMSKKTNPEGFLRKPEDYPYGSYCYWICSELEEWNILDKALVTEVIALAGGKERYKNFVESKIGVDLSTGLGEAILEANSSD